MYEDGLERSEGERMSDLINALKRLEEPCEHCYGQCIPGACDLTKPPQVCYTITMPLKDFKREATNAYYNRDIEALTALLDKVVQC